MNVPPVTLTVSQSVLNVMMVTSYTKECATLVVVLPTPTGNGMTSITIIFSANGILMGMLNIFHVVNHSRNKLSQFFLLQKSDLKYNNSNIE